MNILQYIDNTTGDVYDVPYKCEITGIRANYVPRMGSFTPLCPHHFIERKKIRKNGLETYTDLGVKQRIVWVCNKLHQSIHSGCSDSKFKERWGIERHEVLFSKRAWRDGKYQI